MENGRKLQDAHPDDSGDRRQLVGQSRVHGTGGIQHGERLYDCVDSFSSVLRRARADTPPNSSDFLPIFHANYCKKSPISLKRFLHNVKIVTLLL